MERAAGEVRQAVHDPAARRPAVRVPLRPGRHQRGLPVAAGRPASGRGREDPRAGRRHALGDPARRGSAPGATQAPPPRLPRQEDAGARRPDDRGDGDASSTAGRAASRSTSTRAFRASRWRSSCAPSSASTTGRGSTRCASTLTEILDYAVRWPSMIPQLHRNLGPLTPFARMRRAPGRGGPPHLRARRRAPGDRHERRPQRHPLDAPRRHATRTARRCRTRSCATS